MVLLKNKQISIRILYGFMLVIPFLYGLFYEYTAFIAGAILTGILIGILIQKKKMVFAKSSHFYLYTFLIVSYLLATFWAIDKEQAWEGFLKFFPGIIFFFTLMQLEDGERKYLITSIPFSGMTMCLLAYGLQFIPNIKPLLFSENGRLVGFFQYSNTFALYLLIGFIILCNKTEKKKLHYFIQIILISGILLSGSRTVFVLFAIYSLYKAVRKIASYVQNKKQLKDGIPGKPAQIKMTFITLGIFLVTSIGVAIILKVTGNFSIITRLFSISFKESTLIGRFLYNLDGIKILLAHPLGIGYGGYEWVYASMQTATYHIKFVHNDILQQGIDTGIIAMITLIGLFLHSIISKKTKLLSKEILVIFFLHLLLDFDLQFVIMHFVLIMFIFEETLPKQEIKCSSKIIPAIIFISMIATFVYFGIADLAFQKNNLELASSMINSKTKLRIIELQEMTNLSKASKLADEIIKQNTYVIPAYQIKAIEAYQKEEWEEMLELKKKIILLNPYEIKEYEETILMISQALDKTIREDRKEETQRLLQALSEIEELLENVKQKTNPLAYEINDKPNLELRQEIKNYLMSF